MKIIHLSYSDLQGGAARASYRIHRAMLVLQTESRMLVQQKLTDDPTIDQVGTRPQHALLRFLLPYIDRAPLALYGLNPKGTVWHPAWLNFFRAHRLNSVKEADAIFLYWICNGFLGIKTIANLMSLKKPVLWRLSDMWPFTGGCHYAGDCQQYQSGCGKCPQLNSSYPYDMSRKVYQRKLAFWQLENSPRLTIVCPSNWISEKVAKSALFRNTARTVIPTGVNTSQFKPIPVMEARNILNLPPDKKLILFGAYKIFSDTRKGGQLLIETMQAVDQQLGSAADKPEIVVYGSWKKQGTVRLPFKTHALGQFINDWSLPLVYSACDIFVSLSIEDNLPNTIIEALACGVPCVAFSAGGIPELIDHKKNGYLSNVPDTEDLAHGICWVLARNQGKRALSRNARQKAQQKFDINKSISRYNALAKNNLAAMRKDT